MAREIFISYSRKDKNLVHPFIKQINQALGIECWLDLDGIESGEKFQRKLMKAIDECKIVLFMLSDNSLVSEWTEREVMYAEGEGKRIVPVIIDGEKLRGWFKFHFGNVNYVDIRSEEERQKLIKNLRCWLAMNEISDEEVQKKEDSLEFLNLRPIKINGKFGFADGSGKVVIPCQWRDASPFSEGLAKVVNEQGYYGFIDRIGKMMIPCLLGPAGSFSNGLARVKEHEKWGYIDMAGKLVIGYQWKWAEDFAEGLAHIKNSEWRSGFIDKSGKEVIPCEWSDACHFHNGLAPVQNEDGKWGYIDKTGKMAIPFQWKQAWPFSDGFAEVEDKLGEKKKIDKTGKILGETN